MLQVACIPNIVAWILVSFATNVWYVYISRLLVGLSNALLTTSIYAIEISTKDMRATFNFLEGVPRCFGSIIVYILGIFLRWKIIAYFGWSIPFIAGVWLWFCPESPVFLINQNKEEEALQVLKILNSDEVAAKLGILYDAYIHQSFYSNYFTCSSRNFEKDP